VCASVLQILYKDHHYVAINKPAGLLVHRSPIDRHETRFAVQLLRDQIRQRVYPLHRLDKPTSGVLIFGLDSDSTQRLAHMFEYHAVQKTYVAVVRGYVQEAMTINHPLSYRDDRYDERNHLTEACAQSAITELEPMVMTELPIAFGRYTSMRFSLVKARPRTGRKHQIRRHMKHISHPIIGDANHGKGDLNRFVAQHFGCSRLMLAATRLEFTHPFTNNPVVIDANVEDNFQDTLNQFGWQDILPDAWRGDSP
jgi:tRNA pseudouridine65 synthase